jgi:antitoxin YefM
MSAMSCSEARQRLDAVMDEVCDSKEALIITRHRKRPVVLLSLEEWEGLHETMRLLTSPGNAERLRRSIDNIEAGRVVEHDPT